MNKESKDTHAKAYELMLGDWVNSRDAEDPRYGQVTDMVGGFIYVENYRYLEEYVLPIKLTSDMLLANDFEVGDIGSQYVYEGIRVYQDIHDMFFICAGMAEIKIRYVHELQRALRSFGKWYFANHFKLKKDE